MGFRKRRELGNSPDSLVPSDVRVRYTGHAGSDSHTGRRSCVRPFLWVWGHGCRSTAAREAVLRIRHQSCRRSHYAGETPDAGRMRAKSAEAQRAAPGRRTARSRQAVRQSSSELERVVTVVPPPHTRSTMEDLPGHRAREGPGDQDRWKVHLFEHSENCVLSRPTLGLGL